MVSSFGVLVFSLVHDGHDPRQFFRGSDHPRAYIAAFVSLPKDAWSVRVKALFIERLFEASKSIDAMEQRGVKLAAGMEVFETDEDYGRLASIFPDLRGGDLQGSYVQKLSAKLLKSYPEAYRKAKPFHQSVNYRGYASPVNYLFYRVAVGQHKFSKSELLTELRSGAIWEKKHPEIDAKLEPYCLSLLRFQKHFPEARPTVGLLGYSVSDLYNSTKSQPKSPSKPI